MAVTHDLPVDWSFDADGEAFDSIYRQHKAELLAFCRSRLDDAGDAEDACQEAFLRAYGALPRFDRAQRLWPWLATIAANVCTDMLRRKRPVPLSAFDGDPRTGIVNRDHGSETMAAVDLVGAAIRDLPETYRRPVYLADLEGWSYDEIARHEQKSLASVRSTLMRGRAAFKTRVQALAEERGMWPLSAILPVGWFRRRLLAVRSPENPDIPASLAPSAVALAQAAAAAIALLSTMMPATGVRGASGDIVTRAIATEFTANTPPEVVPRRDAARDAGPSGRSTADGLPAPDAPKVAVTDTDVDIERQHVHVSVGVDTDGDGQYDHAWLEWQSDCDEHTATEAWHEACKAASDLTAGSGSFAERG